jgi:imidazolonepropionase-like amidohydrolase
MAAAAAAPLCLLASATGAVMPAAVAAAVEQGSSAAVPPLAAPPTGSLRCDIAAGSTTYGKFHQWQGADGARWSRDTFLDRGYSYDIEQQIRIADDGSLRELRIRGTSPTGDVLETFSTDRGRYSFRSPIDKGGGDGGRGAFYVPSTQSMDSLFALAESLARAPDRKLRLVPSGEARLEPFGTLEVEAAGKTKTLTGYMLGTGLGGGLPIWFDREKVFGLANTLNYGIAGGLTCLPPGWESVAPRLKEAQEKGTVERAAELVARLAPRLDGPVAFTNVRLYDSERRAFVEDMTVVVRDGMIVAAGPASRTAPPAGARIVAGAGKTLVPGLWDSHVHYGGDDSGPLLLSLGITSIRDPGAFAEDIISTRQRIEQGRLLAPRTISMMIIDGPGPLSVFVAQKVADEAAGLEAVRFAKKQGFAGIKFYGSLDPKLVAPLAREAKRLGLRVQGHVPHGMRALEAVRAGYDEINHGNFLLMQALPQSVVDKSDTLERHYGPMRLADAIDFASPGMKAFFDELAARRIVVDPTLTVLEHLWTHENGEMGEAFKPIARMLPFEVQRAVKAGGLTPEAGVDRARILRAFDKLKALVPELYRRGIRVVAGTDGAGLELVHELELYVGAGLSPAEALATATIIPAEVYGAAAQTGSITVGKRADLVLVAGDPGRRIGDLRNVELVLTQGRLMEAAALRRAAGLLPPE